MVPALPCRLQGRPSAPRLPAWTARRCRAYGLPRQAPPPTDPGRQSLGRRYRGGALAAQHQVEELS